MDLIPVYKSKTSRVSSVLGVLSKVPWHTLSMMVLYIVLFYTIDYESPGYMRLVLDTDKLREAYRWWSYSLLHLSTSHVFMNAMMLFVCGGFLEFDNGIWRSFLIYNFAILGGACGFGWSHRFVYKKPIYLVGASGGIYGLLSSQTGNLILNWNEFDILRKVTNTSLLGCVVISDIITNAVFPNPTTSYSTHVGGFITGILSSICLVKNIKVAKWETELKIATGVMLGSFLTAGFINLLI